MEVFFEFSGDGEFSGLVLRGEGVFIEYGENGSDYRDFLVDCLNKSYDIIASGRQMAVPFSVNDLKRHHLDNEMVSQIEDHSIRLEQYRSVIEKELAACDFSFFRDSIETIFVNDKYLSLSTSQKYYAFLRSQFSKPEEFNVSIVYSDEPFVTERDKSRFYYFPVGMDYDAACKQLSRSEHKYRFMFSTIYLFQSLMDAFAFLFLRMISENLSLGKCSHCGRYFVPNRRNEQFCTMPSPEDPSKSCREYVRYQQYLDSTHEEAARLYKQIYNSMRNKYQRSGSRKIAEELTCFREEAATWKNQVKTGEKTEDDYIDWLYMVKNEL